MARRRRLLIAIGTRPEAIKLSSVIRAAQQSSVLEPFVVTSGQQGSLIENAMASLGLAWDMGFPHISEPQTLAQSLQRLQSNAESAMLSSAPSAIVVQGDTTTAYAFAVVSALLRVPVAHVEAGLRTYDPRQPFPEEFFRRAISTYATWHFAPTPSAERNLICERIPKSAIWMTGNTVVDAAQWAIAQGESSSPDSQFGAHFPRRVLVTSHRRENFESGLAALIGAVNDLARRHTQIGFIILNHSNPHVSQKIASQLMPLANTQIVDPLPYVDFMKLLATCDFIMTDSGGLQEEAACFGIPTVVVREVTERMELIGSGLGVLSRPVSSDVQRAFEKLLSMSGKELDQASVSARRLFGDGNTGTRIIEILEQVMVEG